MHPYRQTHIQHSPLCSPLAQNPQILKGMYFSKMRAFTRSLSFPPNGFHSLAWLCSFLWLLTSVHLRGHSAEHCFFLLLWIFQHQGGPSKSVCGIKRHRELSLSETVISLEEKRKSERGDMPENIGTASLRQATQPHADG